MLLPHGPALEADVVIGPSLDYRTARHRSADLAAALGEANPAARNLPSERRETSGGRPGARVDTDEEKATSDEDSEK